MESLVGLAAEVAIEGDHHCRFRVDCGCGVVLGLGSPYDGHLNSWFSTFPLMSICLVAAKSVSFPALSQVPLHDTFLLQPVELKVLPAFGRFQGYKRGSNRVIASTTAPVASTPPFPSLWIAVSPRPSGSFVLASGTFGSSL